MERFIIDNFGGLKKVELDISDINIFIGSQGAGKSITAKLLFYFKNVFQEIFKGREEKLSKDNIVNKLIKQFIEFFPEDSWSIGFFEVCYLINNEKIRISREENDEIQIEFSNNVTMLFDKSKDMLDEIGRKENEVIYYDYQMVLIAQQRYYKFIHENISSEISAAQIFIPAGRSFFSNLQSSIFSILSNNLNIDPFLIKFGSFYESYKKFIYADVEELSGSDKKRDMFFNERMGKVLKGKFARENEKDYLIHFDNRKVNLSNASSGQQEILPLLVILKALLYLNTGNRFTIYIEEPEAHLFPTTQKIVVELLAFLYNEFNDNLQLIVTTHSPYILSAFNNLIYGGILKSTLISTKSKSKLFEILPESVVITPSKTMAYSFINGESKVLIDEETTLISQNDLDSVSGEIAEEFDNLLNII